MLQLFFSSLASQPLIERDASGELLHDSDHLLQAPLFIQQKCSDEIDAEGRVAGAG